MQTVRLSTVPNRTSTSTIIKSQLLTAAVAIVFVTMPLRSSVARAESDHGNDPHCDHVGGSFVTNFIAPDQTAGNATGDLKGALGVKLLGVVSGAVGNGKPVILKVQHFWVTETGDTILADAAELSAYPGASPSQPLLYSFVYENGVKIAGGTGKFNGASAVLKCWGAVDLGGTGEVAGRYSGTVCFKATGKP
jgi:hypothetical protein